MKHISKYWLVLSGLLTSLAAVASESSTAANINMDAVKTSLFYTEMWFWVIAGFVFFFLLVILLRGSNRS